MSVPYQQQCKDVSCTTGTLKAQVLLLASEGLTQCLPEAGATNQIKQVKRLNMCPYTCKTTI